jgi:hypothetical protein
MNSHRCNLLPFVPGGHASSPTPPMPAYWPELLPDERAALGMIARRMIRQRRLTDPVFMARMRAARRLYRMALRMRNTAVHVLVLAQLWASLR